MDLSQFLKELVANWQIGIKKMNVRERPYEIYDLKNEKVSSEF